MAVTSGFDVTIYRLTGGTSVCTADKYSRAGGSTACTQVKYIDSYSMDSSVELIDTTGFGDRIKKPITGFPSYSIKFSGGLDLTDAAQLALYNAILNCSGNKVQQVIRIKDGNKTSVHRGWLTGVSTGGSVGGKSTFSASLTPTILPSTLV